MPDKSDLMELGRIRTATEAQDELQRELQVRKRCFKRWVAEGRMSATDAQDRFDRLATALELLTAAVTSSGDKTVTGGVV